MQSYGLAREEAFEHGTSNLVVEYFACRLKSHQEHGNHYHVCIKSKTAKEVEKYQGLISSKVQCHCTFSGQTRLLHTGISLC